MAITVEVSPAEKARIAALCYEGRRLVIMLCYLTDQGFTKASTFADWSSIQLSATNGYTTKYFAIPAGAYDATDQRFEIGANAGANETFLATWTATGDGFTYNSLVTAIQEPDGGGGWVNPVGIHTLYGMIDANIFPSQEFSYELQIILAP